MVSEAPPFWWTKPDWRAWALSPFSFLYGQIAGRRMAKGKRLSSPVPVICVGNFTVGGAGKTPTVLALVRAAQAQGLKPGILSRGYGGSLDVTTVVDPEHHRSTDVGDEPLLLARHALTVISRKRFAGARRLVDEGVDLIIMDDGFQSARLAVDFALIVIDSVRGIGNGHLVPGGPVRAPIRVQMRYVDGLLKVGNGTAADRLVRQAARAGKPIYIASLSPRGDAGISRKRVLAFAGIADPEKFFRTVEELGAEIVERRALPDHHHMGEDEIADLLDKAAASDLELVTTAKDFVRLRSGPGRAEELAGRCKVVEVEMMFDDPNAPGKIIDRAIEVHRARRLKEGRY